MNKKVPFFQIIILKWREAWPTLLRSVGPSHPKPTLPNL